MFCEISVWLFSEIISGSFFGSSDWGSNSGFSYDILLNYSKSSGITTGSSLVCNGGSIVSSVFIYKSAFSSTSSSWISLVSPSLNDPKLSSTS